MNQWRDGLSLFLVSALALQAGGGSSCASGGGGATPPILNLPASITAVQTYSYTTETLYNFAIESVSSAGELTAGITYAAWCTNPSGIVPGGGVNPNGTVTPPPDPNNPTGVATYKPVNSYSINGAGDIDYGEPGYTYDATVPGFTTTYLSLAQEWSAVNWVLNHPSGESGETPTPTDTQAAIWQLLHPDSKYGFVVTAPLDATAQLTGNSWLLYQDALAHGIGFVPAAGQFVGVLMIPVTPAQSKPYQSVLVPVRIGCPGVTGSATLTKTSSVGPSGANAFQLVTYTYTIRNTGSTPLQNISILDDNGTPNYREDDVRIELPAGFTLNAGASYSVTSQVYLPISLFYQNGAEMAFDTLIPQVVPAPEGSPAGTLADLRLTYLIDSDVTDNTYGTGASAGWAGNGGHTFQQETEGYAEFAFYNSRGGLVSDFAVNYLKSVGVSGQFPSGYAAAANKPSVGGTNFIDYVSSTLQDNLNDYAKFNSDTVNSPAAGTPNWEARAAYKVLVNEGLFGMYGIGSAAVKKNYLAATKTSYSGKCGYSRATTYTPCIYGNVVNSTAYLCAQACGCSTIVHAKACLSVKLCGQGRGPCGGSGDHRCQNPVHCSCHCSHCQEGNHGDCTNTTGWGWFSSAAPCTPPVCSCGCAQCRKGNHASCTQVGCQDPTCHANNCAHNSVKCWVADHYETYTW